MSERPSDRLSIGGAFGFMAIVGTLLHLAEPNWKKMPAPIIDIGENKMVFRSEREPNVAYVDLRPFGSLDYVIDSTTGTVIERGFGSMDGGRFGILYRTAVEQGIIREN
jgi:hypothetical protein